MDARTLAGCSHGVGDRLVEFMDIGMFSENPGITELLVVAHQVIQGFIGYKFRMSIQR